MLNAYCQQSFFPSLFDEIDTSSMISTIYNIPGHFLADKKLIKVQFSLPPTHSSYHNELENAIKTVNERAIFDHDGRKLIIAPLAS